MNKYKVHLETISCRFVHGARASWSRCRWLPCMLSAPAKAAGKKKKKTPEKSVKVSVEPEQRRPGAGLQTAGAGLEDFGH